MNRSFLGEPNAGAAHSKGMQVLFASLEPSESVRSSFTAFAGRPDSLELVYRGAVVATAHLAYPRR